MEYLLGKVRHRSAAASVCGYHGTYPRLAQNVFLADGARVAGNAELGDFCSVWFNTVIRADVHFIKIGQKTNIQDGAIIHCTYKKAPTIIGNQVSIAHLAMIHGCTIEDNCLVGMQAIIMDGAVIGKGSIVGAGAVVTQGTIVPPKSLVLGSPAKVVRQVTDAELQGVLATTERYIEYCKGYDFVVKEF